MTMMSDDDEGIDSCDDIDVEQDDDGNMIVMWVSSFDEDGNFILF